MNHCAKCVRSNGELNKVIDCDFFENKLTLPRHFKVKRRFHRSDEIIKRLDAIMEKFEVELPENNSVAGKHNYIDENALKLVREYNRKG